MILQKIDKTKKADLALQLIAGTQKHLAGIASLMFASGTFTPAQVEAQLQALATLRSEVEAAKATAAAKLATETAQAPALIAYQDAFVAFVKAAFGNSPDVLADFGLLPKKARTPLTVEQKAAAKAKRDATRKARGTMGSKQKLAVKGNVTGVTITATTSAASASHGA
jgi:hypothetical protein